MSFQEYAECGTKTKRWGKISAPALVGAIAVLAVCIGLLLFHLVQDGSSFEIQKTQEALEEPGTAQDGQDAAIQSEELQDVCVHVAGCVVNPGMYRLMAGARLSEAIEAAGGFTEDALRESVNLARKLEDGEQIVVASTASDSLAQAPTGESTSQLAQTSTSEGRVNVNTATEEQLQTITGIGPSKAAKIVAFRESNGSFRSVEDLCQVSGIGEKTLASIRDQICVG